MKQDIIIDEKIIFKEDLFAVIAGPCAVEDEYSLREIAKLLKEYGVTMLRGGANKLRTSPHSFQGMGKKAVLLLSKVAKEYGLFSVTEVTSEKEIDFINKHIDIVLIGTRNMYNYPLLKEVGKLEKPIILKRGMSATVKEWLLAAEYLTQNGNQNIILCERGIRTFETVTRNTLDLASAVYVSKNTPYHVITDPSHATGNSNLVEPMVLASLACGVQGSMIEIHPTPHKALSDGEQMLNFKQFKHLLENLKRN
jgi:3-deoxy-7-phosphoheptulonate synthase